jgi:FkbM family methyltransferase
VLKRLLRAVRDPSFEEVEQAERAYYQSQIQPGMTVFDVGANAGELALLFSGLVGPSGAVHAFEPAPAAFAALEAALAQGRATNVVANALALADAPGARRLNCFDGPFHTFNSFADRPLAAYGVAAGAPRPVDVEAVRLDDYCRQQGVARIDLLKIDVEGAELQVLLGARELLAARGIGRIAFEYGQTTFDMGNRPEEIEALFHANGYRIANIVPGARLFPGRAGVRSARYAMHVATPL